MDRFQQPCNAFIQRGECAPTAQGPLAGLRVAVKDNIAVAGWPTGAGNPDFAALNKPAAADHETVAALRAAGAVICGRTVMDEFAYGADGGNAHYGTPRNPVAPAHTCGGSSCGSASAVAACDADIGLGTDTGGSTRIPPAATGLWGLRPTHGSVSAHGVIPLAPSLDTVGWMTRDGATMERTTRCLMQLEPPRPRRIVLVPELFALSDADLAGPALQAARQLGADSECTLPGDDAERLKLYVGITRPEVRAALGPLLHEKPIRFGALVGERLRAALASTADPALIAQRSAWRAALQPLLAECILAFPTLATRTPRRDADDAARNQCRARILATTVLAPLLGCPELTLPVGRAADGFPASLSLLSAPHSEADLLACAQRLG